jgi:hypothetical protein
VAILEYPDDRAEGRHQRQDVHHDRLDRQHDRAKREEEQHQGDGNRGEGHPGQRLAEARQQVGEDCCTAADQRL